MRLLRKADGPDPGRRASAPNPDGVGPAPSGHYKSIINGLCRALETGDRASWLKASVCLALLAGLIPSHRLWLSARNYPLVPALDALPAVPPPADYLLFGLLLALVTLILFSRRPGKIVIAFVCVAAVVCILDQSRLQPWFYQYAFMLAAFAFIPGGEDERRQSAALNACRFIVAAIYFWSGVQKVNASFFTEVFPTIVEPAARRLPDAGRMLLKGLGFAGPFIEIAIGAGLLTRRFRRASIYLALALHLFVLLSLVTLRINVIVWPWNAAMMAFVTILFYGAWPLTFGDIVGTKNFLFHKLVLILFGVMPLFNFFGLWDSYLSANLYSGTTPVGEIHVSDSLAAKLPAEVRAHFRPRRVGGAVLDVHRWSFRDMHVPAYPEERVYRKAARKICAYADVPADVVLIIKGRPGLFDKARETKRLDCSFL